MENVSRESPWSRLALRLEASSVDYDIQKRKLLLSDDVVAESWWHA
jgi:hypothetical protein